MNIHLKEFPLVDEWNVFTFGSVLYGTARPDSERLGSLDVAEQGEGSDVDLMVLYKPTIEELMCPFTTHHVFQFKQPHLGLPHRPADIIFSSVPTFIRNLFSGDSVVNFEIFISNPKHFPKIENIVTDRIIRSYLGLCSRDIKHLSKKKGADAEACERHIQRGLATAALLLAEHPVNKDLLLEAVKWKWDSDYHVAQKRLRDKLNLRNIPKYPSIDDQKTISEWVQSIGYSRNTSSLPLEKHYLANINPELTYEN